MPQVMISYSRKDEQFIYPLEKFLRKNGVKTWIDCRNISPGHSWRQAIYNAVITSDTVLLCLSPNYAASNSCRIECYLAQFYGKHLVPVIIQPCWQELTQWEETKGIEDLFALDFHSMEMVGVAMSEAEAHARLLAAVRCADSSPTQDLIYFSFPVQHAAFATRLAEDLAKRGLNTWISTRDVPIGAHWHKEAMAAMLRAHTLIVVLSPEGADNPNLRREVLLARTRNLPMLPVIAESVSENEQSIRHMQELLDRSYEMRLISEIHWFFPEPDYEALLGQLETVFRKA